MSVGCVLDRVRDVLLSDTGINDWCQTRYGRLPEVQIGVGISPPPLESYPMILILEVRCAGERQGNARRPVYEVWISLGVVAGEPVTDGRCREMPGIREVEIFREQVASALTGASIGKVEVQEHAGQDSIGPVAVTAFMVTIQQ